MRKMIQKNIPLNDIALEFDMDVEEVVKDIAQSNISLEGYTNGVEDLDLLYLAREHYLLFLLDA